MKCRSGGQRERGVRDDENCYPYAQEKRQSETSHHGPADARDDAAPEAAFALARCSRELSNWRVFDGRSAVHFEPPRVRRRPGSSSLQALLQRRHCTTVTNLEQDSGMSLSTGVRNDIKAARKLWLPWWGVLLWMAFCLPVIWLCDHFGRLNMALPILSCIPVLSLLIFLRWQYRRRVWFWTAMAIVAALHALLIWHVPWTSKWIPAVTISAIASADFIVVLWVISAVGRLMDGHKAAER